MRQLGVRQPGPEMRSYQGPTGARPFRLFQGPAGPCRALTRAITSVSTDPQALPGPWGPPAGPGPVSVSRAHPLWADGRDKKVGRAAQGPRGLAASPAPLASSLGGPLYLLAKTAGGCLTKQKQRPFTPLSSWVALCTCWGVAHAVRDPAWRLCFKCSLLLAAASRQTAGPYGLSCPSTPAQTEPK